MFRDGTVNVRRYLKDIVEFYIIPIAAEEGPNCVLQADNAGHHTPRLVTQHLQEQNIQVLD